MEEASRNIELYEFVHAAKKEGAGDEFLVNLLQQRGWTAEETYGAVAAYWEQHVGMPAPRRGKTVESSRQAFLYLLNFLALSVWAPAMGHVLFRLIDHWIPDAIRPYSYEWTLSSVSWSIAAMVVGFPLHLWISRMLVQGMEADGGVRQSVIQRWLTHAALLGTAGTVIVNLICFVAYFLTGEVTARFTLKSLVVMAICSGVFFYYLRTLSPKVVEGGRTAIHRAFALLAGACVLATLATGLLVTGGPGDQRRLAEDRLRVSDLQAIDYAMRAWYRKAKTEGKDELLPASLEMLAKDRDIRLTDRSGGSAYTYQVLEGSQYQLCATFAREKPVNRGAEWEGDDRWQHPAGHHCYVMDAASEVNPQGTAR